MITTLMCYINNFTNKRKLDKDNFLNIFNNVYDYNEQYDKFNLLSDKIKLNLFDKDIDIYLKYIISVIKSNIEMTLLYNNINGVDIIGGKYFIISISIFSNIKYFNTIFL